MSDLLKLLGLDQFPPEIEAEYNAAIKAIEEAERQAAIHAHKVFIR